MEAYRRSNTHSNRQLWALARHGIVGIRKTTDKRPLASFLLSQTRTLGMLMLILV